MHYLHIQLPSYSTNASFALIMSLAYINSVQINASHVLAKCCCHVFFSTDQVVNYTITATNTGNIELFNVTITSVKGTLSCDSSIGGTLAPLASAVCTATYAVTQDDLDAGRVENKVVATADVAEWTQLGQQTDEKNPLVVAAQSPGLDFGFVANQTNLYGPGKEQLQLSWCLQI